MRSVIAVLLSLFMVGCATFTKPVEDKASSTAPERIVRMPPAPPPPPPAPPRSPALPPPGGMSIPAPVSVAPAGGASGWSHPVQQQQQQMARPPRPGVYFAITGEDKKPATVKVIFRDYLVSGFHSKANPYNFVLFPRKAASEEEHQQYMDVCRNWMSNFAPISEAKSAPSYVHPVPFYWLVKSYPKNETCEELIELYDYMRAKYYAIERGIDLSRIYLVYDLPDGNVLMDITKVQRKVEMTKSFQLWREKTSVRIKSGTMLRSRSFYDSAVSVLTALSSFILVK